MDNNRREAYESCERAWRGHRSRSRSRRRSRQRGGSHQRSRSYRRSRSTRKRYRSPSRSSYSGSRYSSNGSAYSDSSSDESSRRHSRHRRRSPSRRTCGTAEALLKSKPYDLRHNQGVLERPATDWVCGVCSNPNSVNRKDCYRCGTIFSASINAVPSDEIRISNIPEGTTFSHVAEALRSLFSQYNDKCRIVAHDIPNTIDENNERPGFILFDSVTEATKALTYARSVLSIGDSLCPMEFSLQRRAKTKHCDTDKLSSCVDKCSSSGSTSAHARQQLVEGLPRHLQPGVWKPIENFSSISEEKEYLDELSRYWEKLTQAQKDYYDESVRRTLAAQRRRQPTQVQAPAPMQAGDPTTAGCSVSAATSGMGAVSENGTSLQSVKNQLVDKKPSAKDSLEGPKVASKLKERLAMKKAQLNSTNKTAATAESDGISSSAPITASSTALPSSTSSLGLPSKDLPATQPHLFFGLPIPQRFPTKTDYLLNSKSLSFRAGVIFRYVPPAVAERILPPSLRPPST
ncbi:unnamed protein product [Trypanosoma congolense IL3000]|uniref:WGS project CAEQ00000000 data, annotated contig 935 n=1 Tax=Trypanosoma congolense (strain IL3000) TaxID=1068625 RepID=F9WJP9_TRYCI|nr:unnamed protein product [Trypanosoma congolense IL3000]